MEVLQTGQSAEVDGFVGPPLMGRLFVRRKVFPVGRGLGIVTSDLTDLKRAEEESQESVERFRAIAEATPYAMFIVRKEDRRWLYANAMTQELFGEIKEISENNALDTYWDPSERQEFLELMEKDGKVLGLERRGKRANGEMFWARVSSVPLRFEGQDAILTSLIDITEEKTAREDLAASQTLLQTIFDTLPVGVFVKDAQGRFLMVNRSFCEPLSVTSEDLVGKFPDEIREQNEEERARMSMEDRYVMESDSQLEIPAVPITFGDKTNWYHVLKSPLHDHDGKVVGVVGSRMDITGRLHIEGQLRHMEKMEAVGKLAGGMAHEFNNILHMILGFTELTLNLTPPEDSRYGNLSTIKSASERGASLVRQLLGYSRKQLLQPARVEVNPLLSGMTNILVATLGGSITLNFNPGRNLPAVRADSDSIQQILLNLCLNARDAMPDGGKLTIETRGVFHDQNYCDENNWAKSGGFVRISVTDNGTGIPEDVLPHIFEPFYTTKGPQEGSGLGLSMVHGLIEQQKGFLNVSSEPGKSSKFDLYFPVEDGAEDGVVNGAEEAPAAKPEQEGVALRQPASEPAARGTILAVEDETGVQQLAAQILMSEGYLVMHAFDGLEGLRLFEEFDELIDLVLLDVVMPGMDGKELYQRIRSIKPEVAVIFHSGYQLERKYTDYIAEQGVRLLQKPYTSATLLQAVDEALAHTEEE